MDNKKMGRKLNMDELEQVTGGSDPNLNITNYFTDREITERYKEYIEGSWNHTPSCIPDPAKFAEHQIQRDESARIRENIANGKDYKIF